MHMGFMNTASCTWRMNMNINISQPLDLFTPPPSLCWVCSGLLVHVRALPASDLH